MNELDDVMTTVGVIDKLRALIAALEADLANYVDVIGPYWTKRALQAEAELDRALGLAEQAQSQALRSISLFEQAEAERDNLKCCGNCTWACFGDQFTCGATRPCDKSLPLNKRPHSRCHYDPSRWQHREGGE
jgi:hypothetical protein